MPKLPLTITCWGYDRVRGLMDGTVQPKGIDLNCLDYAPFEIFARVLKYKEFDGSEFGFAPYIQLVSKQDSPFIAIPVFPLRFVRLSLVFVNVNSGIKEAKDLVGKRVGWNAQDAPLWIKGILQDEYGVPFDSVTYYVGGLDRPGPKEDLLQLPSRSNIKINYIGSNKNLSEMLEKGEIDALYCASAPDCFMRGSKNVKRLFEDYETHERAYVKKYGFLPMMHTFVLRKDVYERNRWIANSLFRAFCEAKNRALEYYRANMRFEIGKVTIPWIPSHLQSVREMMGDNYFPYGFQANKKAIEKLLDYHYEQGLSERKVSPEELFAPETLELVDSFTG
jgi:4,5-dihydroxyphthalate decarboxylase